VIIRTGTRLPSVGKIKRACPDTLVCLEINSAYFDEEFQGLPLRHVFQKWEVARFRRADIIFVVSAYLKGYLEARGITGEKIQVNQNGVTTEITDLSKVEDVRQRYGIPAEAFVIGYVGGMERFRRLPQVVEYVAQLRRDGHTDIYLLMVGDGADMQAVRAAIAAEHDVLQGAVILTGWVPHADVPGFLATFDLAIFPFTNAYCSPLKLFEYLGAGIPTLGPDTPAVREAFEEGVHIKLAKQDGSDFLEKILEMKADSEMRHRMGIAGRKLVLSEYTWERNAERVVQHMQTVRITGAHAAADVA